MTGANARARGRVLAMETFRRCVGDLDRAVDFYCDALGFELDIVGFEQVGGSRRAVLTLGAESIELVEFGGPAAALRAGPERTFPTMGFQHIAIVARDMSAAFDRLARACPRPISIGGPIALPPSSGGVTAFKFRDPDGHPLELIHFPSGSGDPRWQRDVDKDATIGVDHSAIVVGDIERSMAFYTRLLGFSVDARQVNQGHAQDRLDGLAVSVVEVVALRPAEDPTPHLELLGYRHPAPSRSSPLGTASEASDLIVWAAEDLSELCKRIAPNTQVSARDLADIERDRSLRVCDPDGHRHLLVECDVQDT